MNMEGRTINGKCLYTPKGAAREYAAIACNFYRGCPYRCRYCYNRRGITAGTLGGDKPVLMGKFTNMEARPRKLAHLTAEEYALHVFREEMCRHYQTVRNTGIFFSFTTDPFCPDCFNQTLTAAGWAVGFRVPVKVLTKNASYDMVQKSMLLSIPREQRRMMSIGFTLTGRDDQEPCASRNDDRVKAMEWFHGQGFRTFASIEPIVDFGNSCRMIRETLGFCGEYLIGLMSKRPRELPPYGKEECARFIADVDSILTDAADKDRLPGRVRVYWKESVRKFMAGDDSAVETLRSEKWYGDNI